MDYSFKAFKEYIYDQVEQEMKQRMEHYLNRSLQPFCLTHAHSTENWKFNSFQWCLILLIKIKFIRVHERANKERKDQVLLHPVAIIGLLMQTWIL